MEEREKKRARVAGGEDDTLVQKGDDLLYVEGGGMCVPASRYEGRVEPLRSFLNYKAKPSHVTFDSSLVLTEFGREHFLPYQHEACAEAVEMHSGRCIMAHEMGLGKTPIAAALAAFYGGKTLFGVPAPKLDDFVYECERWVGLKVHKIESRASLPPGGFTGDAYVISLDLGKMIDEVMDYPWDCVIVDEAHRIRGSTSIVSESWFKPLHRARAAFLLTGTPQVNRPSDLYNLLHALHPEVFGNREAFSVRYSGGKLEGGKWEEKPPYKHQEELGIILGHFMIRRRAEQGGDDFTRVIKKIRLPLGTILPQRQWTRPKSIQEKQETNRIWKETTRAKFPTVFPMMYDAIMALPQKQSALVFFYHLDFLGLFAAYLHDKGMESFCRIDGSVPVKKRQAHLVKVCSGEMRCALLSLKSSAEALNITPGATHVFFPELPFNPMLLTQAEGRAHRKGQIYPVKATWFIATGTYDDTVFGVLSRRLGIFASVVDREKGTTHR